MAINDKIRSQRLAIAVDKLAPKFGLRTFISNTTAIAQQNNRQVPGTPVSPNPTSQDIVFGNILERFINVTTNAETVNNFSAAVNRELDGDDQSKRRFGKLMTVIADDDNTNLLRSTMADNNKLKKVYISSAAGNGATMLQNVINPRECSNISIICSRTPQLSLKDRNVNACTIFLNGIRSIDMSKAVPYLEVSFEFPLAATGPADAGSTDSRILAPSLYKFILGGNQVVPGSPMSKLVNANRIPDSAGNFTTGSAEEPAYTRVGMEVFTSPQTLVNGNETDNESQRLNPVQDKFRPFMSLKEFSATVGTNGFGTMSYSTAKLSMVLHDKSRLAEIAPFIKADIRGKTRVEVEYGWIHPDGEALVIQGSPNYYADIINGMRKRERYQIPTSTFSFTDTGEVNIELNLVTLGTVETQYDLVGTGDTGTAALDSLRSVQETIDELIRTTRLDETAQNAGDRNGQPRLAGLQVIGAVADGWQSGFRLDDDARKAFVEFVSTANNARHPQGTESIIALRGHLRRLYGADGRGGSARAGAADTSIIGQVKASIASDIKATLGNVTRFITQYNELESPSTGNQDKRDPFLNNRRDSESKRGGGSVRGGVGVTGRGRNVTAPGGGRPAPPTADADFNGISASLATILTNFIGYPLARAGAKNGSWDEVQFIYYTFNSNAGYAHDQNISSFEIDLNYFYDRYQKLRMDNISRSGNLTLSKFWQFLNQDIIDDLAAPSYELWDGSGALQQLEQNTPATTSFQAVARYEEYEHNKRLSDLLAGVTHNGEWKPPQLEFALENLKESSGNKKILRIHVYDKTAASSEGLNAIIAASRQQTMSISGDGAPVNNTAGNGTNTTSTDLAAHREAWKSLIDRGIAADIVEAIDDPDTSPARYKIKGGFRAIKRFAMNNSAYLIPGAQGSLIKGVSLASMQDPNATIQMISNPRPSENIYPNNSGDRGLPLYLMPVDVSMDMMGCPLIAFTSNYFIDFNTNTSIDDLWMVSGIDHKISEGSFSTNVKFRPVSGYGHYVNYLNQLRDMSVALTGHQRATDDAAATDLAAPRASRTTGRRTAR